MKRLTKLMALVVVAVMATMAMAAIAWADSTYKITVNNTNQNISIAGKEYTAYKLFDATYSGDAVSYTINKDSYFYTNSGVKAELEKYFTFTTASGNANDIVVTPKENYNEAAARTLADALKPYLAEAPRALKTAATVPSGKETVDIEPSGPGYYLVDGGAANATQNPSDNAIVAAVALTTAKPTATINPKADAPSVDKKITKVAGATDKVESDGKTANGSVGDKVEYELASKVPDMTGYSAYSFVYTDTMSNGLTFNNDVVVKINNETIGTTASDDATSYTVSVDGKKIIITFANFVKQAANAGKDIKITYSATINEDAISRNKEDNTVTLEYSHNPYDENLGTPDEVLGKTPESKTEVYDTNIQLTKIAKDESKLTGAKFKIAGNSSNVNIVNSEIYKPSTSGTWYRLKNGTYTETAPTNATESQYDGTQKFEKVTSIDATKAQATDYVAEGWVKSDSTLSFNGLGEGTYTITEIVSPEGYNLLTSPISVVVTFDADTKAFTAKVDGKNATVDDNTIKFDVENNKGAELPSTGGMGTTILYVVGGIMVLLAGVYLVARRRASKADIEQIEE